MKYICENGHEFMHVAEFTEYVKKAMMQEGDEKVQHIFTATMAEAHGTVKTSVCPECHTIHFKEASEPDPANVYVYEFKTSGPQTELDALLTQGYRIVARYSGKYYLEKPKETTQ